MNQMSSGHVTSPLEEDSQVAREEDLMIMRRHAMEQEIKSASIIADLRLDLGRAIKELHAMHQHCAALAERLEASARGGAEEQLRNQLATQRDYTRSLLQSTSWRVTRPLRGLGHLLREVRLPRGRRT
jgi:hypothetical protein